MNWLITMLYGLFVIWTGLLRGIEAKAFKPNSFWFCLFFGLALIGAAHLFRLKKDILATLVAVVSAIFVLGFYLFCFVYQPEKDATIRVGLVIVASIGYLSIVFLPLPPDSDKRQVNEN